MNEQTFITKSSQETQELAEKFAKTLKGGKVLALFGNLGSGKTTFAQGLAKGLGIKQRIISPTFIIVRSYKLRIMNFYHVDLYRVKTQNDIQGLGFWEILNDNKNIIAIEWAEKIKNLLPKKRTEIYFNYIDQNKRKITVKKYE